MSRKVITEQGVIVKNNLSTTILVFNDARKTYCSWLLTLIVISSLA